MAARARNARPPEASEASISDPFRECFRGVPRKEVWERGGRNLAHVPRVGRALRVSEFRNRGGSQTRERMPRLALWSRDISLGTKRRVSERRVFWHPNSFARVEFSTKKKPGRGPARTSSWRCDRNVALDESFRTRVILWKLFFCFPFWTLQIFWQRRLYRGGSGPTADLSRPGGRERSAVRPLSPL